MGDAFEGLEGNLRYQNHVGPARDPAWRAIHPV